MTKLAMRPVLFAMLFSVTSFGQQKPSVYAAPEFPVTLRQKVEAGKTPVGTRVEARLTMATLVGSTVIPEGAIFSGEVLESTAKSATAPSRLRISMDSVRWKQGSASLKAHFTAWFYPVSMTLGEDGFNQPPPRLGDDHHKRPECCAAKASDAQSLSDHSSSPPFELNPIPTTSDRRQTIEDVELVRAADAALILTSNRRNVKLDKSLTYVLASSEITITR